MDPQAPVSLLALLGVVAGALCLSLGLGSILSRLVANWSPSAVAVGPKIAVDGGGAADPSPRYPPNPAPPLPLDAGGGSPEPRARGEFPSPALSPAPLAYQAIVLAPAGRFGNYWQAVGRCSHEHPNIWGAWDCACLPPVDGLPAEYLLAVGSAE
jgi:hypothetical protein